MLRCFVALGGMDFDWRVGGEAGGRQLGLGVPVRSVGVLPLRWTAKVASLAGFTAGSV